MRCKEALIDSIVLKVKTLKPFLKSDKHFIIDKIKGFGVEPKKYQWIKLIGKHLDLNLREAYILTYVSLTTGECKSIPIKQYHSNKKSYFLEFAGLKRYEDNDKLFREFLDYVLSQLKPSKIVISRLDIAMDYERFPL